MANITSDDVYNDPDNILANTNDKFSGAVELPKSEVSDMSQSIYTPEKSAAGDDRGPINELEDNGGGEAGDKTTQQHPEDTDFDGDRLSSTDLSDEKDVQYESN